MKLAERQLQFMTRLISADDEAVAATDGSGEP